MKRSIFLVITFVVIFTSIAHARTYKIGMLPWVGFSPNNVADVKGFWKAQGVDVQVINVSSVQEMHNALIYKRIDIAHEMIGTWVGLYMDDHPLTVIAELDWSHGGDKIIFKKDFELNELKGQLFGVYSNKPSTAFFVNQYLMANNLKLSDVRLIELDIEELSDNFIAGRFQAILTFNPEALRAEREGNGKVAATSASYPGCIPEGYAARADVLKEIPKEDLAKILKGWVEAVKWIKDEANWEEYKEILNSTTFESDAPYSDEDLRGMLDNVRIHDIDTLWERNKDGGGLFIYLQELRSMLEDNGLLRKDFTPQGISDNSPIVEVLQDIK
jgi:NitT/TauT family transport system substrate-binding protein